MSTILSQQPIGRIAFTLSSRPALFSSAGAPALTIVLALCQIAWLVWGRKSVGLTVALSALVGTMWLNLGFVVALDAVEGRLWTGPYPLVVSEQQLDMPGGEAWIEVESCGLVYLCLSPTGGKQHRVYVGPLAYFIARDLDR